MSRVLVVDDEPQIRRTLAVNLRARDMQVELAANGADALRIAADTRPDLILLDVGLPDMSGVEVIHGLRGWTEVPIIMLTVRSEEADKVEALDAGADDYLTKPFGMNELLARMRAALRRSGAGAEEEPELQVGDMHIDLIDKRIRLSGEEVHLTPTEWALVEQLVRNRDRLVTQRQLLHSVWGPQYDTEANYLRVHMANVRSKLEADSSRPRHFLTEPGLGYRFVTSSEAAR